MRKTILTLLIVAIFFVLPVTARAVTADVLFNQIQSLLKIIGLLQTQIVELKRELNAYSASSKQSCVAPKSCIFGGQTIAHGSNVIAYKDSTVPYGSQCQSQVRTCIDGILDGSYTNATCQSQDSQTFINERSAMWNYTFDGGLWHNVFDGSDTPSDNVPNPFRWDIGGPDDWNYMANTGKPLFSASQRLNYPSRGFMDVDTYDVGYRAIDKLETGNFWIRDPLLDSAVDKGMTVEMRVKLYEQTDKDGFIVSFVGEKGRAQWRVSLTPTWNSRIGTVRVGTGDVDDNVFTRDFGGGSKFHTIRITQSNKQGSAYRMHVYIDGVEAGYAMAPTQNSLSQELQTYYKYPQLLIGDASNAPDKNAAYVIDYVKYRLGSFAPSQRLTPVQQKPTIPSLPISASISEAFSGMINSVQGFNGALYGGQGVVAGSLPNTTLWNDASSHMVCSPSGTTGTSGITLEVKARVKPNSDSNAWVVSYLSQFGTVTLSLSPDGITMSSGTLGVGFDTYKTDLTDKFHKIRLVLPKESIYAYVYLDDNPIPVIYDYHIGGDVAPYVCGFDGSKLYSRLFFGSNLGFPVPNAKPDVEVEYVRWNGTPRAPYIQ